MRELLKKLLDEENRQADLAAFGQIVALFVSVFFSFILLGAMAYYAVQTGKIDTNAFWILSLWVGAGLGYGVADKKWGGLKQPEPPTAPQQTAPATSTTATVTAPATTTATTTKPPEEKLP